MFKARKGLMKALLAFSTGLMLLSCTTVKMYSGPDLPADQVAIIESSDLSVNIESCDGIPTRYSRLAVLPGEHAVEMSIRESPQGSWTYWSINNSTFSFIAQAGHTYAVGWKVLPEAYDLYVVVVRDKTAGGIVPLTSESKPQPLGMYFDSDFFR
ncbi:MAG TPA: hypothetical protein VHO84_08335 [Syntrophorhabdaceae bacterium]|nr:hypothetical protein [Syntrophorhabdaceae bacterium]